jgi:CHAT domain-containing protein
MEPSTMTSFDVRRLPLLRGAVAVLAALAAAGLLRLGMRQLGKGVPRSFAGRLSGMPYAPRANDRSRQLAAIVGGAPPASPQRSSAVPPDALQLGGRSLSEASRAYESCTRADPSNVRCWNDLAVARLEEARVYDDPRAAADAFGAADHALRLAPASPEALFNRAASLEALRLNGPAAAAWRRYLLADSDSPWALEAREHLSALPSTTRVELWDQAQVRLNRAVGDGDRATIRQIVGSFRQEARTYAEAWYLQEWAVAEQAGDAATAAERLALARSIGAAVADWNGERLLADAVAAIDRSSPSMRASLARAHVLYRRGKDLYADRKIAAAEPLFEAAAREFLAGASPMSRMADQYLAACRSDAGDYAAAITMFDRDLASTPPEYAALRGQLLWSRATAKGRSGLLYEPINDYTAALEIFRRCQESINIEYVTSYLSALYAEAGRESEAWRLRQTTFADVSRGGHPRVLQSVLSGAARSEAVAGRWNNATAFYKLSLDPSLAPPNAMIRADSAIWFSLGLNRAGLHDPATAALEPARRLVTEVDDAAMRAVAASRLRLAEAVIRTGDDPRRAVELLTSNVAEADSAGVERYGLPEVLLERGRAWSAMHRDAEAIADHRRALSLLEARERAASVDEVRESYFTTAQAATEALVDLLDRRDDSSAALAAADWLRSRAFGRASPVDAAALERLPPDTLLLHYTALRDRLLIAAGGGGALEVARVPIDRGALERAVGEYGAAVQAQESGRVDASSRRLFELLLAPVQHRLARATKLVIVPDASVAAVPFAALRAGDGTLVVETKEVRYATSAADFLRGRERGAVARSATALVVGNPAFDTTAFPRLPMLPSAESEARAVAREYRSAIVLTGADATRARVVGGMAASGVIDLACHTLLNPRDASRSALLLAPDQGAPGTLSLQDVARLSLASPTVVLSGCRTAVTVSGAPPVLANFANAFLAAGSRSVVGTLWPVDDQSAREVSRLFHRDLAAGSSPAEALRNAQLAMLRSGRAAWTRPSAWAAFQVYGNGS